MDLDVQGRHALLFDDDASASFVNSRAALVPWIGDESLLIDRYDVRHLLDRIPPRPKKQRFVEDTGGVPLSELDRERFLDLPLDNDGDGDDNEKGRSEAVGSGSYQAVPFSYGNSDGSTDPNSCGPNHSAFHPPFSVPSDLLNNLPPTEKLHHIMARTALFVSKHGGQSEIVLRVKQGDNPTFGFLMPDNQLHPYFRFLVNHPQLLKADSIQEEKKPESPESEALGSAGGALSLLGSVYGTGEDDDNAPQQESNEGEPSKLNTDGNSVLSHKSGNEESASVSLEDKELGKHAVAAPPKEKIVVPKKNLFANSGSISKKIEATTSLHGPDRHSNQPGNTDAKPLILEPPSFLKRTIEKIVEFILRNGKEFEAVLIEQDKTAGRFLFLLPSNQYHSYYLKVLQKALESKSFSKNPSEESRRRAQAAAGSESPTVEEFENWSLNLQRKEKFKMVIGSKKESANQPMPVKRSGVTADEAAAIVLAATRGRSPAFQTTSVADSNTGRASSLGSLSLNQPHNSTSKPAASNGEAGDVSVATAIAKTAALATASEADSSDASLTKEQKLKAERLRRAKMFAAMIKGGSNPMTQLVHSGGTPSGCVVPTTAGSNHEEREGSCLPFEAEASSKERNYRKKHNSKEDENESDEDYKHSRKKHRSGDHKHRKDRESRHGRSHRHHKHLSDSEDEDKHEKSHRHHHRRHKHHSSSENEERHGKHSSHKHHSDSENEGRQRKSSRHRHRKHEHDLSEDEDRDRSSKHGRKHRSPSEKREELEEGELREKSLDHSEVKSGDRVAETLAAAVSDTKPSDVTEVPSDLRAKIRAMLLETI